MSRVVQTRNPGHLPSGENDQGTPLFRGDTNNVMRYQGSRLRTALRPGVKSKSSEGKNICDLESKMRALKDNLICFV